MESYLEDHLRTGHYRYIGNSPRRYENAEGWTDYRIGDGIVFSHRENRYTVQEFHDFLHAHDYYEVLFWKTGNVRYISNDRLSLPAEGSVIAVSPHDLHTTHLLSDDLYDRYVFYFSPSALSLPGSVGCIPGFFQSLSPGFSLILPPDRLSECNRLLTTVEKRLQSGGPMAELAAYSATVELFLLLSSFAGEKENEQKTGDFLPENIRAIRSYLESHYATIRSVEEVARHFYYSREYLTRLFRRYYNLSPGDYLAKKRIREATRKIENGEKIADVCFDVGFRSISAFSEAFRRITGRTPSEVRNKKDPFLESTLKSAGETV